jgi:DNA-binding transcriptional MocR family regulator
MELLYEKVADHLASMIDRGTLAPGDRLPSVRRLARQQHVSISTVVQAYLHLENRGLVEARPQSGHYVRLRRAPQLPEPHPARPSATASKVAIADMVARVYRSARDPNLVPFGAAQPDPALLPTDKLNRMMSQIAREADGLGVIYDPPPGYPGLRRAIARKSASWGCALTADDLVTTVGCMEALLLCVRAVARAGDAIAVESPTYYGLLQLLESLEIRVFEVPGSSATGLDLVRLEELMRAQRLAAVLAIPNFNNPLGSLMPDDAKEKLVGLCRKHEVPLIEDDIYGDLGFAEDRPRPAKAFDRDGGVMLCGSFSKTIAPGYRVGWCAPGRWRDQVERLKFAHTVATPTLPQMAIAEFLENGGYDHHLRQMRRRLAAQVDRFTDAVAGAFPEGTRISRPRGGFVLWVELPANIDALDLHARAYARGISIAPGPIFSAKQRFTSYIRINCGYAWSDLIERSIQTLGHLAHELA